MQQERGGSSSEDRKQLQDRRLLKPMQGGSGRRGSENQQALLQPPQQKCPRCESLNTKFCYYNNYSLSQPRYFCKTCRRYWTQGGTLRNVPVGGSCRKGKRTNKTSSATAGPSSRSSQPQQPNSISSSNPVSKRTEKPVSSAPASSIAAPMGSYFPSGSGGLLSSLASVQTQSLNPSQQLHQALSTSNNIGGPSNLGLLQGFSAVVPSPIGSSSSQQSEQSKIIYQIGNTREKSTLNPLYYDHNPSEHHYQGSSIQTMRSGGGDPSQHEAWLHQAFLNSDNDNNNNPNVPADDHDTALWSASSTTNSNANTNTNPAGSVSASFNPNHEWPGYGPPL